MIFLCERDKNKERRKNADSGLVKVLDAFNIQHFKYNTDTNEIIYMNNHELHTHRYLIDGESLNHTCKIKNIEDLQKAEQKPSTDLANFILAKANFKDLEEAKAAFAKYTTIVNADRQKLTQLKQRLESGNY